MLRGHYWTVAPLVREVFRPITSSPSIPWETSLTDPHRGPLRLTGRLHPHGNTRTLVVVIHGLGGTMESHYVREAVVHLAHNRLSALRINLRGADYDGSDFYHAGLIQDLDAVLESPEVQRFDEVFLWGSSLGAHLSLRYIAHNPSARVRGLVAVCPPLDLEQGATAIDAPQRRPYLMHLLRGLATHYEHVARRHSVPVSIQRARAIRSLRTWDNEIIAPRFGFASASDYYAQMSAGKTLSQTKCKTLLVVGKDDPMIPTDTVVPSLAHAPALIETRLVAGGHVGFSPSLDLGERASLGLCAQASAWIARHSLSSKSHS